MGSISFLLPDPLPAAAEATLQNACLATGYDMAPVPGRVTIQNKRLVITRSLSESGSCSSLASRAVWDDHERAQRFESDQPYRLLIELARGKLNQVRTQTADWEGIGLRLPDGYSGRAERYNSTIHAARVVSPHHHPRATNSQPTFWNGLFCLATR